MTQLISYWDDNVLYEEGPFVVCRIPFNCYRIEVEVKGSKCPCLPDIEIYGLLKEEFGISYTKTRDRKFANKVCDFLNQKVKEKEIILTGAMWRPKKNYPR